MITVMLTIVTMISTVTLTSGSIVLSAIYSVVYLWYNTCPILIMQACMYTTCWKMEGNM